MKTLLRSFQIALVRSLWPIVALSVITAVGLYMGFGAPTAGFLFLLCVVVQAKRGDFWSATIVATVAAFAIAFFFTPPPFSFGVANPLDAISLLTFVIVAFVIAHLAVTRTLVGHPPKEEPADRGGSEHNPRTSRRRWVVLLGFGSNALAISAFLLVIYGVGWTYATHRYLKGFADAIVPLEGSSEAKSEALLTWLRRRPERLDDTVEGSAAQRDPVDIVQNARLLKVCGSAANAFINLADAAGLRTRRLLLLDESGSAKHVVAEVQWGERWVVVDPQRGRVFKDRQGRALTKEELHDPEVFQDAISRMPGYSPLYTFERTAHLHLSRIPLLGNLLRRILDRLSPSWEEAIDWGYFAENPSLWPILICLPLLLLSVFIRFLADRNCRNRPDVEVVRLRERLMHAGRALFYGSAMNTRAEVDPRKNLP